MPQGNPQGNPEELLKLYQEYYIVPAASLAPHLAFRLKAEPQYHEAILDAGYEWDEEKVAYLYLRLNQSIAALPQDQFIWMIGDVAKVIRNPEKLQIWLGGRGDDFVKKLFKAAGIDQPITFKGTGERPEPYEPSKPVGDETDQLIKKLTKQAGSKKTLPSDTMIDLGLQAQKTNNQKLLNFLKTINPMNEGTIKGCQLNELIRYIVIGILNEAYQEPQPTQEFSVEKWVETMANKIWPDPQDIGRGGVKWRITKQRPSKSGEEEVFMVSKSRQVTQNRFIAHRGVKWYYLDPTSRKWKEIPSASSPVMHPPEDEMTEMTGTGAAAPISTPFAFKKKKMEEDTVKDTDICPQCGKKAVISISGVKRCPNNHTWTDKKGVGEMTGTGAVAPISTPFAFKKKKMEEITATSAVAGYNIPAAFSKTGGSEKGVKGSESLGYTLTAIGKKEMKQRPDRLYENEKPVSRPDQRKPKTKTKTCPHCNMMAINGTWTHEAGCPNSKDV